MKQASGWKRIVARIRGEVPTAALEASWLRHAVRFWLRWSKHERAPALLAT